MQVPFPVTIDLNRPAKNVLHLGQGDTFTRYIEMILLCDSVPYDPTEDLSAIYAAGSTDSYITKTVAYLKPNGVGGEYAAIGSVPAVSLISGTTNRYKVLIDEHATDVSGFCELFVRFSVTDTSGNVHILHSFPVTLEVGQVIAPNTDPTQPYFADFIRKSAQAAKTNLMTSPVGVDAAGKLWVSASGAGGGMLMVTEVSSGTTDYSYSDIATAHGAGTIVRFTDRQGIEYDLEKLDTANSRAVFSTSINGGTAVIQETATVSGTSVTFTSLNGYVKPSGGIPDNDLAIYETTISYSSGWTANHAFSDILDAYNAEKQLRFVYGSMVLRVDEITGTYVALSGIDASTPSAPALLALVITSTGVAGASRPIGNANEPTVETVTGNTPSVSDPDDNTVYNCTGSAITSVTVASYAYGNAFTIKFNVQATTTPTISFDSKITFPDGFQFSDNKHYEINVDGDGYAVVGEWPLSS